MRFVEFLRDITIAAFLLVILLFMAGCSRIYKNVHVYNMADGTITVEYSTQSTVDVDAEDLADATIPLPIP